jgi:hypothetical protein
VTNGELIATGLVGSFRQATNALRSVEVQVRALPTNDSRAFLEAARRVGGSVQSSLSSIGTGLSSLRNSELLKASTKSQACKNLGAA